MRFDYEYEYLLNEMKTQADIVKMRMPKANGSKVVCYGFGNVIMKLIEPLKALYGKDLVIYDPTQSHKNEFCQGVELITTGEFEKFTKDTLIFLTTGYIVGGELHLRRLNYSNVFFIRNINELEMFEYTLKAYDLFKHGMEILSDEKSLETYVYCMLYRYFRENMPNTIIAPSIATKYFYNDNISKFEAVYTTNEYFPSDIPFKLEENEIFVDGGSKNGNTVVRFIDFAGKRFSESHSFELSKKNYKSIGYTLGQINTINNEKINIYNIGLWDEPGTISYNDNEKASGATRIDTDSGKLVANVDKLDNILRNKKVTFIKFDLEGAEMPALRGATEIIIKNRPKLAICIYHSNSDMLEIPNYISSLVQDYKFFIRHHNSAGSNETVFYAIPNESVQDFSK